MKVLVTGAKGQLGHDVVQCLKAQGIEEHGIDIDDFDLTDMDFTFQYIKKIEPDVVIHCAAYTDVSKAEIETEKCRIINVSVTANIARACKEISAKLVYISTDYIFPGIGELPYETDSETGPLCVYGQTKLDAEKEVLRILERYFIIRTSWAFGANGGNFINTILQKGKDRESIPVVCDQVGSPTYTADLAPLIVSLIQSDKYGIYHVTNEGYCSWAEFADEIFHQVGYKTKVEYINTEQYPTTVVRPKNSRLSKVSLDIAGFNRLPKWQDALGRYLREIGIISQ